MAHPLFEAFSPAAGGRLQIMDDEGRIIHPEWMPALADEQAVEALRRMLYVRTADAMAVSYQRQGRMYTYPPNYGQEAISVAVGMVMRDEDWLAPAYRELGAWLAKGARMKDIFLYFGGHEQGCRLPEAKNMLPWSVPIASQLLHAAGIGYALKYQGKPGAAFTFFGEGGTSQGDFHEALNFASVWQVPVVFVCQNNGWAISCPRSEQTRSRTIAQKAIAYDMPGVQVDGNDPLAVYRATREALARAYSGGGPTLIEAVTYRMLMHTTSDDPTRYRPDAQTEAWRAKDPLVRFEGYLRGRHVWDDEQQAALQSEVRALVDAAVQEFETAEAEAPDALFEHVYGTRHALIDEQRAAFLAALPAGARTAGTPASGAHGKD